MDFHPRIDYINDRKVTFNMKFDEFSDEELKAELTRRETEKKVTELKKEEEYIRLLSKHQEALMEILKHSRTSCSDIHPGNVGRCSKCDLIEALKYGRWDERKYRVVLESQL